MYVHNNYKDTETWCNFNNHEVSDAPKEAPAAKKFASYNPEYKSDEQKKEEVSVKLNPK